VVNIILITGGCGSIGSHIIDRMSDRDLRVIDNLSSSTTDNIKKHLGKIDLVKKNINETGKEPFRDVEEVYHMAASPEVKLSGENPRNSFENNVAGTFNVLENCRLSDVDKIIFSSTSTVYGNAHVPTPENHPFDAVSNYGATKVAGEAMIKSYQETYGINYVILRYANIFGPRSKHGVIYDFFQKLKKDPSHLQILGNGEQNKSYLYIEDCADATIFAGERKNVVFNVGSETQVKVKDIASMVSSEMGLSSVRLEYTGGEKGWKGDVPVMLLDITKIKKLGWKPKTSMEEGIKRYIAWLNNESLV
jgi:UDP-glucose 4-epimerase